MLKRQLIFIGVLGGLNILYYCYKHKCNKEKRSSDNEKNEESHDSSDLNDSSDTNLQMDEVDLPEQDCILTKEDHDDSLKDEDKHHLISKRKEINEMSNNLDILKNKLYDIQSKLQDTMQNKNSKTI